uniref:Uncharacterized protein n=1 Tax=Caenorhabditis japonica TaxID=281687 RepID=A0A8R1HXD6_CAEJA
MFQNDSEDLSFRGFHLDFRFIRMASLGWLNVAGILFSIYFYTWLHPDLTANVRIGFDQFKVDHSIYFGTVVWLFFSTCLIAPRFTHRICALAGNIGMAVCSIGVIVNHWLLENKWVWGGLMYVCNIVTYSCFMGLSIMGQNSTYHYDRNRLWKLAIPIISTMIMTLLCFGWIKETKYSDVMPWVAFNFFTIMAILAQVAAPRTEVFDFFAFLNKKKRDNDNSPPPVPVRQNQNSRRRR